VATDPSTKAPKVPVLLAAQTQKRGVGRAFTITLLCLNKEIEEKKKEIKAKEENTEKKTKKDELRNKFNQINEDRNRPSPCLTPWCAANCGRLSSIRGPSGPKLTLQGRKRDVVACRPPRRCVVAYCHAGQRSHQTWAQIGCDEACVHHACDPQADIAASAHATTMFA
jgi:FtsZ-binding cell division protein ZapB